MLQEILADGYCRACLKLGALNVAHLIVVIAVAVGEGLS